MRIAMIHSSFGVRGGAEQYVRDITLSLMARGHDVRVFCRTSEHDVVGAHLIGKRVTARLGERLPRPIRKGLVHLGDLVDPTGLQPRDLTSFAPDVVHVHNWQEVGAWPVGRIARTYPTCHTVHDHAISDPNNALGNLGRSAILDGVLRVRSAWILRRFRRMRLIFSAERTRNVVLGRASGRPASLVLPLAVPVPWHRLEWPQGDQNAFLFIGALSPHKGLDMLLDVWRSVEPRTGGTLMVAGDGPLRADVERLAADMPSVRYLGYLDEEGKRAAFSAAGWLIFPSQGAETFGLVCAEALMAGRPVIAAARSRPPVATDLSTIVFKDRDELARSLIQAAGMPSDEYLRRTASAAEDGRKLDWDDHVDALVAIYESLRHEARPAAGEVQAGHVN
jgi:glycosyltransferase involved in cell wall biosynthesis